MDKRDYAAARKDLQDSVFIKGPAGEAFRSTDDFLKMMGQQRGRYDIKKVFAEGDDVCLLYNEQPGIGIARCGRRENQPSTTRTELSSQSDSRPALNGVLPVIRTPARD